MEIVVKSPQELSKLAEKVAKTLQGGEILALVGTLGAGKTTFTKALLKALKVKEEATSPTFVLMIPYEIPKRNLILYHIDLYRIKEYKEVEALGIPDLWNKNDSIFVIEWADKIKEQLPLNTTFIQFDIEGEDRRITITNDKKQLKI